MADQTFIQVRVDEKLKQEATDILDSMGMDMPTAVRMFLKKIVIERGLPFDTKLPSYEYIPAKPSFKVSMQEYMELVCQVPAGRITRNEEIHDFLARKHSAERVEIVFTSLNDNPLSDGIPWWRVVSSRGMLYDQMFHNRDEQKKMLENDGLSIVSCGAYGKSLKVDNYKDLLFKDFH